MRPARMPGSPGGIARAVAGHAERTETVVKQDKRPPRIVQIAWRRMEVEGPGVGRTSRCFRAAGAPGTRPKPGPGTDPASSPPTSRNSWPAQPPPWRCPGGMNQQLHVHPGTFRYLDECSITVHVAQTRQAVRIYNDLTEALWLPGSSDSTSWFPLPSASTRTTRQKSNTSGSVCWRYVDSRSAPDSASRASRSAPV
jgi:hypothetical protein